MRQAIIVQNPKWEPFTKASDAFKSITPKIGETTLLVVRGRCKEKSKKSSVSLKSGKNAEWVKSQSKDVVEKLAKVAALFVLFFAFSATAQQNILPLLPITTVPASSTNTTAGSGVVGWVPNQVAVFQLTATGTNALAAGTIEVSADTSDNGTDWVASAYTIPVVATGTNAATTITLLTNTVGGKYIRFAQITNTNAAGGKVVLNRFTVSMVER